MKISDGTVVALARALAKQADVHGMPWHVRKAVLRDVVPYLEFDLDASPAVPQPADERPLRAALEKYFSNGGPDTPIRTTWHEGVEHWEAPADDIRELIAGSAVPQPVDREALVDALMSRKAKGYTCLSRWEAEGLADEILALLNGSEVKS